MWDPAVYLKFAQERGRPFHEMVARIGATRPRTVVDLGCGPGNLTQTLTRKWPGAAVLGVDSSPEMIAEARAKTAGVSYVVADVRDYEPSEDVDVIVSNALFQWVPGHEELLLRWATPGRWIAVQVPANHYEPAHTILRDLCASPKWTDRLGSLSERVRDVPSAIGYARLLRDAGCEADTWETKYIHQLPVVAGERHPVLVWLSGTGMRPVRKALPEPRWEEFCDEYEARLLEWYPPHKGVVDFAFLRVFAVAHRPAG
jgi:trans-aconitate 2-methyltransferase